MEQSVHTAHTDMIHDAQLDYYGKTLATCSSDRTIKIFDVSKGDPEPLHEITGHDGPVWQVSWAHPRFGVILASCSYDRTVRIWRRDQSGTEWLCLHICQMSLSVNSISWAPQEFGLILGAASSDGSVCIIQHKGDSWIDTRIPTAHQIGVNAISWRPANAGGGSKKQFVTGGCDKMVSVWEEDENGEFTHKRLSRDDSSASPSHQDWVRDVAWAPNIGVPSDMIASCSQDGQVTIWTKEKDAAEWSFKDLEKFNAPVWKVSWSITGSILAVSSGENEVTLWKESLVSEGSSERKWIQVTKTGEERLKN
eukprot:CAMPEP_0201522542 /NCGR_PEP_ID=MMETSP0161_2-20130828/18000_1 /ASSEMBLY_ACC=CAM_ASM_000251 /TAXON_ID=180227 /ORGANISM="Neoparamoeba aestuarina, Strain SoJaBio B1-5/56/2" /LENGTH=308 /DNA_ID=CAMNT_0047921417 /DNA_START=58 /DNA_END=984 /DNA_ORIENTATION=-